MPITTTMPTAVGGIVRAAAAEVSDSFFYICVCRSAIAEEASGSSTVVSKTVQKQT